MAEIVPTVRALRAFGRDMVLWPGDGPIIPEHWWGLARGDHPTDTGSGSARVRLQMDLVDDREILQLGPAGAPPALLSFWPRGQRVVAVHLDDPVSPVVPITTLGRGIGHQPLNSAPDHR